MELMAVRELLRSIDSAQLLIQADSEYVIKAFTERLPGWRKRGMRTSSLKQVKNVDMINDVDELLSGREVSWERFRGDDGHDLNEQDRRLGAAGGGASKALGRDR